MNALMAIISKTNFFFPIKKTFSLWHSIDLTYVGFFLLIVLELLCNNFSFRAWALIHNQYFVKFLSFFVLSNEWASNYCTHLIWFYRNLIFCCWSIGDSGSGSRSGISSDGGVDGITSIYNTHYTIIQSFCILIWCDKYTHFLLSFSVI